MRKASKDEIRQFNEQTQALNVMRQSRSGNLSYTHAMRKRLNKLWTMPKVNLVLMTHKFCLS